MKHIDTLVVILGSFLYSFFRFSQTCKLYVKNTFDNQALFMWDYNALIGQLPYKDIFYPYGILSFYKDHNVFASGIYILILPTLLTILYLSLKKVISNQLITIMTFIIITLFIDVFTGWEVFNRYGILVVFGIYIAHFFSVPKRFYPLHLFLCGLVAGLVFSFITDIGMYCGIIFIIFVGSKPLLEKKLASYLLISYWVNFCKQVLIFLVGLLVGTFPLFVYLFFTDTVYDFINASVQLSTIVLYAKTPFFPGLKSFENIFVFSVLFVGFFYLAYTYILTQKKVTILNYIEVQLVVVIILLEQKSIIRSIDRTIPFVAVLLLCFLVYELLLLLKQSRVKNLAVSYWYSGILISLGIVAGILILLGPLQSHTYNPGIRRVSLGEKECIQNNIKELTKNTSHMEVINYLEQQIDFDGKVFSFPFDPIFYTLFSQKTPYYSNTYDSSGELAQNKQITFMKANDIQYVIINTQIKALQDDVPEYIRSNTLLKYILREYKPIHSIDSFLILQKTSQPDDFFTNGSVLSDYKKYLLHIDLKHIPATEGIYKYQEKVAKKSMPINGKVTPEETLLLFTSMNIIIKRNDGVISKLSIQNCEHTACLVHLARIPLLFNSKNYTYTITSDNKEEQVYSITEPISSLW